jgi:hypothetical protein
MSSPNALLSFSEHARERIEGFRSGGYQALPGTGTEGTDALTHGTPQLVVIKVDLTPWGLCVRVDHDDQGATGGTSR